MPRSNQPLPPWRRKDTALPVNRIIFAQSNSLELTLGCDKKTIVKVERVSQERNISDYERAGNVSEREAEEMIELAAELRRQLLDWLQRKHLELI